MADNPVLSSITLPSGHTYDFKDAAARADIEILQNSISGGVTFYGETSTPLEDGDVTGTIVINERNVSATTGMLVAYQGKEFVYDGASWNEMGDLSVIGALGFKNSASGDYTPAGTNSTPIFTGVSMTSTGNFTPEGSIEIDIGDGTVNYVPTGTVSQPSFLGAETILQPTFTPSGSVEMSLGNGQANYVPAGTVTKPDITVTPTTDSVYSITDPGSLPSLSMTVTNENLAFAFSPGTLPTKGAAQTVMTGATAALNNAPSFSGTGVDFEYTFTGTQGTGSVTYTPSGTVTQPTFSGAGVELVADFTGTQGSVSVSGTPEGTVSAPTFTGITDTVTVT